MFSTVIISIVRQNAALCGNRLSTPNEVMRSFWLTHSQTTNFRLSQTEEFADDNFKFDENGRKFSKWVESTVEKGEIARYEQFLLFPQCF